VSTVLRGEQFVGSRFAGHDFTEVSDAGLSANRKLCRSGRNIANYTHNRMVLSVNAVQQVVWCGEPSPGSLHSGKMKKGHGMCPSLFEDAQERQLFLKLMF